MSTDFQREGLEFAQKCFDDVPVFSLVNSSPTPVVA